MQETDEESLIREAQHNAQAFITLYDRYVHRIYAFAYRRTSDEALAKDITSATFEKALRYIQNYRWRGISFGAWLYRIASNELTQHYRHQRLSIPWRESDQTDVETTLQRHEQHDALQVALSRLAPKDQALITLRFFEELSSAEVAEIVGISLPTLYLRLHRALQRLRKHLKSAEDEKPQEQENGKERVYVSAQSK